MHQDFQTVVVAQIRKPLQVRYEEAAEGLLADERAGLTAKVDADEEDVDDVGG